MLKRLSVLILLFWSGSSVMAIDLDQLEWFDGEIYLMDGNFLKGKISYSVESDIVKIDQDGKIKAFSPVKVNHFSFYDDVYEMKRTFYALPHKEKRYGSIVFFELIHEGEVALLSRLNILHVNQRFYVDTPIILESEVPDWARIDNYFILKRNGDMFSFNGTAGSILAILDDQKSVREFIRKQQIDLRDREDLAKLMQYYDSIFQS